MATRTTDATASTAPAKGLRVGLNEVYGTYSYGAGLSASAGDVIQMVKVPKGARVTYVALSGGSGDMLASLGDGVSTARYLASTTMGSALSVIRTMTLHAQNVPYVYSTDDTIDVTIGTISVGTITGGFHLTCIFSMDS